MLYNKQYGENPTIKSIVLNKKFNCVSQWDIFTNNEALLIILIFRKKL